ncbi:MAG: MBL fold metallo-hydrolase [Thomasclavelia sp.]|nr:MBL fold metallo-hydrolase [Thomasclavelia sp.]
MEIKRFIVSPFQTNCYVIYQDDYAIVIDPGDNGKKIIKFVKDNNLNIKAILLTHGHIDHIGAVDSIYNTFNCPVYINEKDNEFLTNPSLNLSNSFNLTPKVINLKMNNESKYNYGDFDFEFIHTPGHTPGSSIILLNKNIMFSGDTLFKDGIGRTDFPKSSNTDMKSSLNIIKNLATNYTIYPGHGEYTTLDYEKENNVYLKS